MTRFIAICKVWILEVLSTGYLAFTLQMVSKMQEEYFDNWVSTVTTWDSAFMNHSPNSVLYAK